MGSYERNILEQKQERENSYMINNDFGLISVHVYSHVIWLVTLYMIISVAHGCKNTLVILLSLAEILHNIYSAL